MGLFGQFGSSVGIFASYTCTTTLDSPVIPQLLGSSSSFTLQITQNIGNNNTQTITRASRTLTDLTCDGTAQDGAIFAPTDVGELPLLEGIGVAVVTMRVCDLFGCAAASSVGVVNMS